MLLHSYNVIFVLVKLDC